MPQIVVAVDGSKHSEKVVDVACQFAKDLDSSIVLIYVLRKIPEEPEGVKAFEESEHYKGGLRNISGTAWKDSDN